MTTSTEIEVATYNAVRAEVRILQEELLRNERFAVLTSAGVFAWLTASDPDFVDTLPTLIWFIPLIVTMYGALKTYWCIKQINIVGDFLRARYAQKFTAKNDCWEHYLETKRKTDKQHGKIDTILTLFWMGMFALNITAPVVILGLY